MPFGLTNTPAVFLCFTDDIFRDLLDVHVILYLDDSLIFSNAPEKHKGHVMEVLKLLQDNNLYCNPDKCDFYLTSVTYIGRVVITKGSQWNKTKCKQSWNGESRKAWNRSKALLVLSTSIGVSSLPSALSHVPCTN